MKNLAIPVGIFILAVLAGVGLMIWPINPAAPMQNGTNQNATTTTEKWPLSYQDLIEVNAPSLGATTLAVSGKARGNWYFEASFPVELRDASGKTIAQSPAAAQGDWMTTEYVPFTASLTFPKQPAGSKGVLVLKNDNPSGDPARDKSVEIPVTF